jgi:molybdopterin synthase sulfur carrier subunit
MSTVHVQYYAVLREQAGRTDERVVTTAATPAALYDELRTRRSLTLARTQLRVAIDGEFADWQAPLADGARVVFIPPVAGG